MERKSMLRCVALHYSMSLAFHVRSMVNALVSVSFISLGPQNYPQGLPLLLYLEAEGSLFLAGLPQLVIPADGESSGNSVL